MDVIYSHKTDVTTCVGIDVVNKTSVATAHCWVKFDTLAIDGTRGLMTRTFLFELDCICNEKKVLEK